MNEVKRNFSKWIYWFSLGVAIIFVYKFLDNFIAITSGVGHFFNVITPFLSGALIAYLLYIPASRIEKGILTSKSKFLKRKARGLSVFLTIVIAILGIMIIINVILPVITESIVELVSNFQNYWNAAVTRINNLPEDSILKNEKVIAFMQDIGQNLQTIDFKQYLNPEKITGYVKSVIGVASGIFDTFVTIVVSVYILLERGRIVDFTKKVGAVFFDKKACDKISEYCNSTNQIFYKFITSQLLDAVVVGILVTIAMLILRIKYAILFGFMIGLFNIIPYFGAIIAVGISILINLITGGLAQTIIMTIVVIIIQQLDANIINPKIIGNSLEISRLLIIFAISVGGAYFGVLGMFLGVPIIAVVKIAVNDYIMYRLNKKYTLKNDELNM